MVIVRSQTEPAEIESFKAELEQIVAGNRTEATDGSFDAEEPLHGDPAEDGSRQDIEVQRPRIQAERKASVSYQPTIRQLPTNERPRERLREHGPRYLNNAELVAILLRSGIAGENAINLATRVLTEFEGLGGLARVGYGELFGQRGLSHAKTCEILAALELGRRIASLAPEERAQIACPQDAANLVAAEMAVRPQEHLIVLLLNTRNRVIGKREIYIGTVNGSAVRPAEVLRPAIRENAPSIIVVHNHPSGDPTPSGEDVAVTRDLIAAGKLMDIELLDHLVIGQGGRFVSLKEKGLGFDQP